ncbi:hypothetical protein BC332_06990 [Capsicum chinense]|nr:hypothetical protein BC332_06990 [Capsicum chinense]
MEITVIATVFIHELNTINLHQNVSALKVVEDKNVSALKVEDEKVSALKVVEDEKVSSLKVEDENVSALKDEKVSALKVEDEKVSALKVVEDEKVSSLKVEDENISALKVVEDEQVSALKVEDGGKSGKEELPPDYDSDDWETWPNKDVFIKYYQQIRDINTRFFRRQPRHLLRGRVSFEHTGIVAVLNVNITGFDFDAYSGQWRSKDFH